ncbi:MAG: hypothetical protein MI923_24135 [Phycisphaerales bacterium]|nr:hypothetical protein [Phycisphaerales bacterium]
MSGEDANSISTRIANASRAACKRLNQPEVDDRRLDDALTNAVDPKKLIDNLAEAWRATPDQVRDILEEEGFGGLVARLGPSSGEVDGEDVEGAPLGLKRVHEFAEGRFSVRAFNPAFDEPVRASKSALDTVSMAVDAFLAGAATDPLGILYRNEPLVYARKWLSESAPRIDAYVADHFGAMGPRYLVNSGIGANEQFNYFVSALANVRPDRTVTWLLANSPKEVARLPADATVENTLFMEFSRSGITEETVKLHELTPRDAKRVVFANAGPLQALGERDGNLVMDLPGEVSGRYGRNKTPILMAPMHVAGLDTAAYWSRIEAACTTLDICDRASLPVVIAQYVRLQQLRHGLNHIYLGTNDLLLRYSADEFCQFWNEGVNRDGNDLTMSRYLGLPRDSHMNLEAILGTSERKMAVFLLRTGGFDRHPLLRAETEPLRSDHAGLTAGDVDLVLALANVKRCSEKMPTILIAVNEVDFATSAWLGQLWADTTLVYARLIGVDPGSNPEVKAVRSRAAAWLTDKKSARSIISGDA